MTAIALTEATLLNVKRAVKKAFPDNKSSHITEALAASMKYRTHAALIADLKTSNPSDPKIVLVDDEGFVRRLCELEGTAIPDDEDFDWFEHLDYADKSGVHKTRSPKWYETSYTSPRERAWRNIMVAGINAGIEQRLFSIRPGDNRWDAIGSNRTKIYRFAVSNIPAIASVEDRGYDELFFDCVFWPTARAEEWIGAIDEEFSTGEAYATGWLERREGAWLQFDGVIRPKLKCRKKRLEIVAGLDIAPNGYADRGNFKM